MIQQDRIIELDREDHIKDLGVIFDENLDFGVHIALLNELIKPIACYGWSKGISKI